MLDIRLIRSDPDAVAAALARRGDVEADAIPRVLELDAEWRASDRPGAPARHAYRLSQAGIAFARSSVDAAAETPDSPGIAFA